MPQAVRLIQEAGGLVEAVRALSKIKGRGFALDQKHGAARLDFPGGQNQAILVLYQTARSPNDSFLGGLNRVFSLPLSRIFVKFGLSPNVVSFLALGFSLLGGLAFCVGNYFGFLIGALLTYFSCVLDASDGEVARLTYTETPFGCWLDSACDYLSYFFTFGGLFWGTARAGILPGRISVISILLGLVLSIGVFIWFRVLIAHSGNLPNKMVSLLRGAMVKMSGDPMVRLAKLLSKLPTRGDLGYIILAFAILGQMKAFLVFIAFSVHLVWLLALYVGLKSYRLGLFESDFPTASSSSESVPEFSFSSTSGE